MVGAGALDRRVEIQAATEVPDATGHPVKKWTTVAIVWARKRDASGRERFQAQQTLARLSSVFTIRWRAGITPAHQLVEGNVVWDILGVAEVGRRQWLELTCEGKVV